MEVRDSNHLLLTKMPFCVSLALPGWPAHPVRAAECSDWFGGLPALSEEGRTTSFNLGLVSQLCFPDLLPEDGKCQTPKLQTAHPGTASRWPGTPSLGNWGNAAACTAISYLLPKLSQAELCPVVPAVSSRGAESSF